MKKWEMTPQVFSGEDSLTRLEQFENEKVCLVCDPFLIGSESLERVMMHLVPANEVTTFSDIVPDPPIEVVAAGVSRMQEHQPTVLVAVGGGSAIDTAKAMLYTLLVSENFQLKRFIAIPTTSGTGSEVTSASVVTDTQNKIKYPIFDKRIIPDEALLDAALVVSSPQTVTAYSGLDVLTHALEAMVAEKRSGFTNALAEKVIQVVFKYLQACFDNGNDLDARIKMHQASCMAGLAFDAAGLGINHAIAHQVGGQFHVPHGLANAILLPHVIEFNAKHDEYSLNKYADIAVQLGLGNAQLDKKILVMKLQKAIVALAKKMQCPMSLTEYGISKKEALAASHIIAENAKKDSTYSFNPVAATEQQLEGIYKKII